MWEYARFLLPVAIAIAAAGPSTVVAESVKFRRSARPVPEHYLVVLRPAAIAATQGGVPSVANALVVSRGGIVGHILERGLGGFSVRLSENDARTLSEDPAVAWVEEDGYVTGPGVQTGPGWALDRIDQQTPTLNNVYSYSLTGFGVHVYALDSGIRVTHAEFGGRAYGGIDFVNDGWGTNDCANHGTPSAAIIGGATFGVAKGASLHPVRVLDCQRQGTWSNVIAAVNWVTANRTNPAVAHLNVIGPPCDACDIAIQASIDAGVVYIVPAGNDFGADACLYSPARITSAVTVAGSAYSDGTYVATNQGPCIDVFAPGASVPSASNASDSAAGTYNGTSFAGPYVAGVAALYLAGHPQAAPLEAAAAITNNATQGALIGVTGNTPNRLLFSGFVGCQSSLTLCSERCVDLLSDKFNCSACGNYCRWGCLAGACAEPQCPPGTMDCCGDDCMKPTVCAKYYPNGC